MRKFVSMVVVLALCILYCGNVDAGVTVKFANAKFAMRLGAAVGELKEELSRPGELKLTGEVTLTAAALPTNGYFVLVKFQVNDGQKSDLVLGAHKLTLKDGDTLTVHQIGIVPPPNAALVPFKGGSILVSLMYPAAVPNPDGWSDDPKHEEFRSSALFVYVYRPRGVAERLAKQAIAGTDPKAFGNFRGDQQISVIRQCKPDGSVVDAQAKASVEELADAIHIALIQLQMHGWHEEIRKARDILEKK